MRRLCAHLSEREIEEAEERIRQYIRLGLQIHSKRITDNKDHKVDI